MSLKLKICGMRDPDNIARVGALLPDYVGFIFYDSSPRFVGEDFILPGLTRGIQRVGVFVNEQTEVILDKVEKYKLDLVQLHGKESASQCAELSDTINVIKAFSVDESFDFKTVDSYKSSVRYFLFDTKGKYYGGNSKSFNWNLLEKYDQQIPFFLSGGITIASINDLELIRHFNVHALDINSGVELTPGMKDINKVREFKQALAALSI